MQNGTFKPANPQLALPGTLAPHVRHCPLNELPACLEQAKQDGYRPQITTRDVDEYVVQLVPMKMGNREAEVGQAAAKKS